MRRLPLLAVAALLLALIGSLALAGAASARGKPPVKPAGVRISDQTSTTVTVRWKSRSKARFFQLKGKPGKGPVKVRRATSATVAGLLPGRSYSFRVRACKSKRSCSPYSKKRRVRTNGLPANPPPFGFNEAITPGAPGNALLEDSGASFVRVPVAWAAVERVPGFPDFRAMDGIATELGQRGLRPLWVISAAPCWALLKLGGGCDPLDRKLAPHPLAYGAYANFVAQVGLRYPNAVGIQVWNEPNLPKFWAPRPSASDYRALLRQTASTARLLGVKPPIVYGAPSPVDAKDVRRDPKQIETTEFLRETLRGGVPGLDATALHPYSFLEKTDPVATSIRLYDQGAKILRSLAPALPIWVTEIGYTTAGDHAVSPEQQAASLSATYDALVRRGAKLISVHRFFDDADPPFKFEAGMGVVRADRKTVKPAYCSLAALRSRSPAPCR